MCARPNFRGKNPVSSVNNYLNNNTVIIYGHCSPFSNQKLYEFRFSIMPFKYSFDETCVTVLVCHAQRTYYTRVPIVSVILYVNKTSITCLIYSCSQTPRIGTRYINSRIIESFCCSEVYIMALERFKLSKENVLHLCIVPTLTDHISHVYSRRDILQNVSYTLLWLDERKKKIGLTALKEKKTTTTYEIIINI